MMRRDVLVVVLYVLAVGFLAFAAAMAWQTSNSPPAARVGVLAYEIDVPEDERGPYDFIECYDDPPLVGGGWTLIVCDGDTGEWDVQMDDGSTREKWLWYEGGTP